MSSSAQETRPSTRQRKSNLKLDSGNENLPPKRHGAATRHDIQPPFWNTPYRKFVNYLTIATLLLALFYTWRITQWKAQAGGWVNLLLGRHPDEPLPDPKTMGAAVGGRTSKKYTMDTNGGGNGLEDRLRDLAYELGIHPKDLASAIRPLIPTASISSIAQAHPTESGAAVSVLTDGEAVQETAATTEKVKRGLAAVMGLDEPVDFDD